MLKISISTRSSDDPPYDKIKPPTKNEDYAVIREAKTKKYTILIEPKRKEENGA